MSTVRRPAVGSAEPPAAPPAEPAARRRVGYLPEHFRFQEWATGAELLDFHGRLAGLVIGIGVHPGKTPLFSPEEKIEMLKAINDDADRVTRILTETGLEAPRLKLEITESAFMEDLEAAIALLWQLKSTGIRLSIDSNPALSTDFEYASSGATSFFDTSSKSCPTPFW